MLDQTARELSTDILMQNEIPRDHIDSQRWVSNLDSKSAMTLTSTARLAAVKTSSWIGYACMAFQGFAVYSCYWKPAGPLEDFETFLAGLDTDIRRQGSSEMAIIIAGGFNTKSQE